MRAGYRGFCVGVRELYTREEMRLKWQQAGRMRGGKMTYVDNTTDEEEVPQIVFLPREPGVVHLQLR